MSGVYNVYGERIDLTKEISILFVGNSLTQDGIAYLPYLLKNYFPEITFKFYMWYNGGYTLAQQYTAFSSNTACEIFSVAEDVASWTNYNNSKTMSSILATYKFDVVCLQEYFNYKTSYTNATDWENCKDYIQSHYQGGNPLEFISLFHAPKRSSADSIFAMTRSGNALILQTTIAQDMLANGIAVYRALSTELDDLGDQGGLSPDGTHTQEGLPCLLQTYVTACWLLDRLGIEKSVYGCDLRMTTAIYNSLNVPGPNLGSGVITGTDAENLLAQEVAIKAYKEGKQMVISNLHLAGSITVNMTQIALGVASTETLIASSSIGSEDGYVYGYTSDPTIASITQDALGTSSEFTVKGVSAGFATISLLTPSGATAYVSVTVTGH